MHTSDAALVAIGMVGALGVMAACTTDYQKGVEDVAYGAPNALAGQSAPGPSTDTQTNPGSSSGATAASAYCQTQGGTLLADAGTCAKSFKTDILPALAPSCSGTACHDGATPANKPRIDVKDVPATYAAWAAFDTAENKNPYINPCSVDATKSYASCNLEGATGCGPKMPLSGSPNPPVPPTVIADLKTWQACGAPNN